MDQNENQNATPSEADPDDALNELLGKLTALPGVSIKESPIRRASKFGEKMTTTDIVARIGAIFKAIDEADGCSEDTMIELQGLSTKLFAAVTIPLFASVNPIVGAIMNAELNAELMRRMKEASAVFAATKEESEGVATASLAPGSDTPQ